MASLFVKVDKIGNLSLFILIFILYIYIACIVFHIGYWLFFYNKLNKYEGSTPIVNEFSEPVSVIISAKNEGLNLEKNLPKVLHQNYSNFEVLVIDDYSTDNTLAVLKSLQKTNEHLKIVEKENFKNSKGKKLAITAAIENSKNDYLLFTDADCIPSSKFWISKMAAHFSNKDIVLGYGPYISKPSLLNKFIRFETIITAMNYFSFALARMPYMGVGRNMAYKKELFQKSNGYKNHLEIASGDDDLFIREVANKNNVAIELDEDTFCYSASKATVNSYIKQKQRHVSTAPAYKTNIKSILAVYALTHFLIYFLLLISILQNIFFIHFVVLFILRAILQIVTYKNIFKKLNGNKLIRYTTLFDCLFIGYYLVSLPGVFVRNNKTWQ